MAHTLYATYRADRFGKLLTVRDDSDPEPLASIPFASYERVTFRMLAEALKSHGFTVSEQWRPTRRVLRAEVTRIRTEERL